MRKKELSKTLVEILNLKNYFRNLKYVTFYKNNIIITIRMFMSIHDNDKEKNMQ